ncbi:penicillin-binding protein [Staphylococcus felis]|uniref:Penicillin-binding protein n=2 Tax=Staphylococcus felis TaxID=46127 RepID=A0AAX1RVA4_9STAP|nr:penicillin-binding protein [Staphylococcus felis]REH86090.1 penicillin-binding protein [Staphylococcus felis]REH86591.1 penicillin-binding protein [Staphylococcus felis]REI03161.1 penicillin-binding protein [Staphylococcus felis]REI15630.1 penicillin-binding protein [Staphylococcus felis]
MLIHQKMNKEVFDMKSKLINILAIGMMILMIISPDSEGAQASSLDREIHTILNKQKLESVMITTQSGQILYQHCPDFETDPASLTKMMTIYLTLDAVKANKIKLNDRIKITPTYEKISTMPSLSNIPLHTGQSYTVEQLILQTLLESSNVATLILGDYIAGASSDFTNQMNTKAKHIGMTHTYFVNPTGASNALLQNFAPSHYNPKGRTHTTAADMSQLVHHLIEVHPEVLKYSSITTDKQYGQKLRNKNQSLKGQPHALRGTDGLKTGTSDKGYSLALTRKVNHLRLNEIVLNVQPYSSEKAKQNLYHIANQAMIKAYEQYEYRKVISKGKKEINGKLYDVKKDLYDVVPKGEKLKYTVTDDNKVHVDYRRTFIKNTTAPSVTVEKKNIIEAFFYRFNH